MRVLALVSVATAFRTPAVRFARAPPVQAALDVDGIKNAIAPSEIGASSQAIYSWGGLALGACSIIKPELVAEKVLGVASSGSNAVMIRGAGLAAALLGARLGRDSDSQAASSAALARRLGLHAPQRGGRRARADGSRSSPSRRCAARAVGRGAPINVAAARRARRTARETVWAPRLTVDLLAGLYNFVTTLDTNGLNAASSPRTATSRCRTSSASSCSAGASASSSRRSGSPRTSWAGKVAPGVDPQCVGCTR